MCDHTQRPHIWKQAIRSKISAKNTCKWEPSTYGCVIRDAILTVIGIDHVQLAMPAGKERAARDFYQGLLGLNEVPKPTNLAGRGGCWFEANGVKIHLG